MSLRTLGLALTLITFSAAAQAPLDIRLALVIGNGAYAGAPLPNPANDAKAMGETLRGLGFSVIELQDASKAQMSQAIARMGETLKGKQAVGMLYYAGHGLQVDWRNFMVPVEARMNSAADVSTQAVDVTNVIDAFKAAGTRMSILVLDACRDNPFGSIASGKGLAQLDAPPGTFLAYATAPGNVAEDGDVKTGNGLYTQFLLQELKKPTARIEDVFKRVRLSVRKQSQGRQIPWESTSLEEDFVFNDGTRIGTRPADLERLAQEARLREQELLKQANQAREQEARVARDLEQERQRLAQAQRLAEAEARQKAEAESRERERQLLLAQRQEQERAANAARVLADARRAEEERLKAVELASRSQAQASVQAKPPTPQQQAQDLRIQNAEWERIKDSRSVDDFFAYLQKYPSGYIAEQAQFRLDQLQRGRVQVVPSPGSVKVLASGELRFRLGDETEFDFIDGYTKVRTRRRSLVTFADSERAEINNGTLVVDQMGGVIRNRWGDHRPAALSAPADLSLGKKWRTAYSLKRPDGVVEDCFLEFKVVGLETIDVPAGRFQAFKVEGKGEARAAADSTFSKFTVTNWIDPATMSRVKSDFLGRDRRGNIYEYSSTELVSFKPGRG